MSPSKRSRWSVGDLIIPAVILGTIALIVHIARPDTGTMFDDDNFGGTVVLGAVAILGVVASGFVIRALFRNVGLRGPCPSCGEVANWGCRQAHRFEARSHSVRKLRRVPPSNRQR